MKIRTAEKKDFEEVINLVRKLYGEKNLKKIHKNWGKEYLKLLKDIFVLKEDNKIVAYISIDKNENSIYIADLYVLSEYRRKRIATKLIDYVEQIRRKNHKKYLRVDVRRKDKLAVKFYKKLNFVILEPIDKNKSWRLIR